MLETKHLDNLSSSSVESKIWCHFWFGWQQPSWLTIFYRKYNCIGKNLISRNRIIGKNHSSRIRMMPHYLITVAYKVFVFLPIPSNPIFLQFQATNRKKIKNKIKYWGRYFYPFFKNQDIDWTKGTYQPGKGKNDSKKPDII